MLYEGDVRVRASLQGVQFHAQGGEVLDQDWDEAGPCPCPLRGGKRVRGWEGREPGTSPGGVTALDLDVERLFHVQLEGSGDRRKWNIEYRPVTFYLSAPSTLGAREVGNLVEVPSSHCSARDENTARNHVGSAPSAVRVVANDATVTKLFANIPACLLALGCRRRRTHEPPSCTCPCPSLPHSTPGVSAQRDLKKIHGPAPAYSRLYPSTAGHRELSSLEEERATPSLFEMSDKYVDAVETLVASLRSTAEKKQNMWFVVRVSRRDPRLSSCTLVNGRQENKTPTFTSSPPSRTGCRAGNDEALVTNGREEDVEVGGEASHHRLKSTQSDNMAYASDWPVDVTVELKAVE